MNSTGRTSASRWSTPRIPSSSRGATNSVGVDGSGAEPRAGHEPGEVAARVAHDRVDGGRLQAADERPQRLDDRAVRDAALAHVRTGAAEHAEATRRRERRRLADEPRLADAGLAGDQLVDGRAAHGAIERVLERGKLGGAPHERRADEATGHARIIGRGGNRSVADEGDLERHEGRLR